MEKQLFLRAFLLELTFVAVYLSYTMRIVKPSTLKAHGQKHAKAAEWLKSFGVTAKGATWRSYQDIRQDYSSADRVSGASGRPLYVLDAGAHFRLIIAVNFKTSLVFIKDFMTHEEYNSQRWKKRH